MNRAIFLSELEGHLMDISKEEREEALAFYTSYFAEAGETGIGKEFEVIKDLGSPKQVADMIKGDLAGGGLNEEFTEKGVEIPTVKEELIVPADELVVVEEPKPRNNAKVILIIIGLVFALPIIISVLGGVIGVTFGGFGFLIGLAGLVIGFMGSGVGIFVNGIMSLGTDLPAGMFYTGVGLGMMVLGLVGTVLAIKLIFFVIRAIVQLVRRIFGRISGRKVV
jgi:uncharacterized membrane protein